MMLFNSIRWRLQLWYGATLLLVLAGFGFTAFQMERGRQFRRIDDELQRRAGAIANALRPPPQRRPGGGERPLDRMPPPNQQWRDRPFDDDPGRPERPLTEFHLPPQLAGLFDESDTNGFYYVVRAGDGKELERSANAPGEMSPLPLPVFKERLRSVDAPPPLRADGPAPRLLRMRGEFRELFIFAPQGTAILVGRSITPELSELRRSALKLGGVGGLILLLGLAGGWWLATRAIRPIEDISNTAVKISAGDLSQRINVADTESELGQLAGVLNSTFARLESSFAQQQQFTSDAAHELRTPVTVMLTETQIALNRERSADEYRKTVEVCQRISQRMRRLTESLLELARLDAGQEQMKRMQFDLSRTAGDCVELVRPLADERGVKIVCDLPPLQCAGDPERLAQVITNLLTNAVNYNKDNGEIRLRAQQENGVAILTVTDTGQGIAAEDLPRVFERFYRADKSRSSGHTGLGLAICKAIVEAHGGTIEVASQPGAGTTFTVRLPA